MGRWHLRCGRSGAHLLRHLCGIPERFAGSVAVGGDRQSSRADAGTSDAYAGAVPADLVLACGVLGNVTPDDVAATIAFLPRLCAPGAESITGQAIAIAGGEVM